MKVIAIALFTELFLLSAAQATTSLDTIITTTCDGTFSLFPDNEALNINIDAAFLPRVVSSIIEALKAQCG